MFTKMRRKAGGEDLDESERLRTPADIHQQRIPHYIRTLSSAGIRHHHLEHFSYK